MNHRILVDTHAYLWFVFDDERLSPGASAAITDPSTTKLLSVVSLWEIAIKVSLGKLELGTSLDRFLSDQVEARELEVLAIAPAHLIRVAGLPFHHRDPFDRLLISQALVEGLPIVTGDGHFGPYGVPLLW
jgi:PIN domain nuclease of toxin-antitoxin system